MTGYILSQQQQPYPSWVPFLGDDRFELKAELSTAQAVTPGQGQTVNISGVKVGDISDVELENGHAVVTMLIEQQYATLIHTDATVLLRPRTGLQDMTLELDPGTEKGEPLPDGATIPLSQTQPNVQPDQILATLDGDTRAYLQLLLQGAGDGPRRARQEALGRPAALRAARPRPGRDRQGARGAAREHQARRSPRSSSSARSSAPTTPGLTEFVDSSTSVLGEFADQEQAIRESLQELPSTLRATRSALDSGDDLRQGPRPGLDRPDPRGPGARARR